MRQALIALKTHLFLTLLLGLAYPFVTFLVANIMFPHRAGGDLTLIGQKFESPRDFWGRPSASDYGALPSSASNFGPISAALKKQMQERAAKFLPSTPSDIPQDLLFASASGLDPDISPKAAFFQVGRVAKNRGFSQMAVHQLVQSLIQPRQFGIFGEPRVNVLKLNRALDRLATKVESQ